VGVLFVVGVAIRQTRIVPKPVQQKKWHSALLPCSKNVLNKILCGVPLSLQPRRLSVQVQMALVLLLLLQEQAQMLLLDRERKLEIRNMERKIFGIEHP
jgi:hypothetical protein